MLIIGCNFHSRFQQIACLDTTTGEIVTHRLERQNGEARKFYAGLSERARVGRSLIRDPSPDCAWVTAHSARIRRRKRARRG